MALAVVTVCWVVGGGWRLVAVVGRVAVVPGRSGNKAGHAAFQRANAEGSALGWRGGLSRLSLDGRILVVVPHRVHGPWCPCICKA